MVRVSHGGARQRSWRQRGGRWFWVALLAGTPLVLMWPLMTGAEDSFPLSTYPMFSRSRTAPTVFQLRGYDAAGRLVRIGPELLGTSEVLQAKVMIAAAVRQGRRAQRELCQRVATRTAHHADYAHLRRIELIAARYDAIAYFTKGPQPLSVRRLTRCRPAANPTGE